MRKNGRHSYDIIRKIQIIYIIATIIWIILFFWLKSYFDDCLSWIFLFIPIVIFSINYIYLKKINVETETEMFQGNYLSFCLLIVIILINWNHPLSKKDKLLFFRILLVAFIFITLTLIDFWVIPRYLIIMKHVKTIFLTIALTLLVLVFYLYYADSYHHANSVNIYSYV